MMDTVKRGYFKVAALGSYAMLQAVVLAQDAAGGDAPAAEDTTEAAAATGVTFWKVVYGGSFVNLLVWLMIAATSFATLWFIIDGLIKIRREKLLPTDVVEGVRDALSEGDLQAALDTCEANPGPLSRILLAGFGNISEGYEVIQESVSSAAELENEQLMQRVSYLNLCGQIAPMLGLLGTVIGMVFAFGTLGTGAQGAAKAQALAQNISTALWTTCVGLLISVPALLAFTIVRNFATRVILESEATVLDLIKVLRNAEVEDDEEL
jgi:biopolymer transport protein ExbB